MNGAAIAAGCVQVIARSKKTKTDKVAAKITSARVSVNNNKPHNLARDHAVKTHTLEQHRRTRNGAEQRE